MANATVRIVMTQNAVLRKKNDLGRILQAYERIQSEEEIPLSSFFQKKSGANLC